MNGTKKQKQQNLGLGFLGLSMLHYSYKLLPSYHFICLYASSSSDSERFYNQIDPTNYKFSVTDIQRCRAHMYNIIQMRFQEDLIPRIIAQTPHMTICYEIRSTIAYVQNPNYGIVQLQKNILNTGSFM